MGVFKRLYGVLSRTRNKFTNAFSIISGKRVTAESLNDLEDHLLAADLGIDTVDGIIEVVKKHEKTDFIPKVKEFLLNSLPEYTEGDVELPTVILVVGINGTGKTTSAAKLAWYYKENNHNVLLVGADTYRAAAVEQLRIWADRLNIRLVCNEKSQEPSAVLFDGLTAAKAMKSDIVIVDTAGRLHTYQNLMEELRKMFRIVKTRFSEYHLKSIITIDASLGQNSLSQAKTFAEYLPLDGAMLTKMDGTAKGGIVFSLFKNLNIPVRFIGVGETLEDLYIFNKNEYVQGLFGEEKL